MKTLKFMLAAATAIGLASASQAAGPYDGSTDFEADTLDSTITTGSPYWIVPAGAEDGDYKIVAGNPVSEQSEPAVARSSGAASKFGDTTAQVLQLEGGTDPLLRNIQASGTPVVLGSEAAEVYVDTLVKFTVTPAGDSVEASAGDKLMIYLKEDLTSGLGTTNLMVKACSYAKGGGIGGGSPTFTTNDVIVSSTVVPNNWYRLQVKAYTKDNMTLFNIFLNGVQLAADKSLYPEDTENKILVALTCDKSTSLSSVGFAGSGAVDDLLFTTFDPEMTVLDFYLVLDGIMSGINGSVSYNTSAMSGTLDSGTNTVYCYAGSNSVTVAYTLNDGYSASWDTDPNGATITKGAVYTLTVTQNPTGVDFTFALGTGVSAVTWTLNGVNQSSTVHVKENDVLAITGVTYSDWYVGTGDYTNGWTKTLAAADVANNFSYTVAALELGNSTAELPSDTQPSAVGISNKAITSTDLNPVLQWARMKSGSTSVTDALTAINGMSFTEGAESQAAKAYLLNCANTAEAVAAAEAAFKFPTITPGTVPNIDDSDYNGTVTIKGGNTLDAIIIAPATSEHKFYKATLTK